MQRRNSKEAKRNKMNVGNQKVRIKSKGAQETKKSQRNQKEPKKRKERRKSKGASEIKKSQVHQKEPIKTIGALQIKMTQGNIKVQ